MTKSYPVIECCPHCEHENSFSYSEKGKVPNADTCQSCGKLIALCTECKEEKCASCIEGSNFAQHDTVYVSLNQTEKA